jgi:hypothetical protein
MSKLNNALKKDHSAKNISTSHIDDSFDSRKDLKNEYDDTLIDDTLKKYDFSHTRNTVQRKMLNSNRSKKEGSN